ncbi:arsenate reductase family protein [Exiguobacterium sp. s193]|uniref:arsenate reductase family protein n=1 Tax=Exiguobacterium sp. s193 TaxID=2751207 RepID=UPI001BEB9886|nr:arsenate reductase family protein [Exiguobacterium sp. s193]
MVTMYGYPKCSTCVKAKKALESNGVEVDYKHIVDETPSAATIRELHQKSGEPLKKFFNTSGQSYRAGGIKDRLPDLSEEEQYALLANDGMLLKRPIVTDGTDVTLGFKEEMYQGKWY